MEKGYLALVLHAHLPFVRHPEHAEFLEENWLFEAITDTYMPLLRVYHNLLRDGVDFQITMNISPSLCAMLDDGLLRERYIRYLDKRIELSAKEIDRTRFMPEFHDLALMYYHKFTTIRDTYTREYGCDLIRQFRTVRDAGKLEIITCAATHGFLPLLSLNEKAVIGQIRAGVNSYREKFGANPPGIWLPECAYYENVDAFLKTEGIKYFLLETHGVLFATPRPKFGIYSSYYTKNRVAVFGRDPESSKSVWSSKEGYPGDTLYREYYRDVGFDLDYEYVRPYISPCGARTVTGIKYYRITGETNHKEPYNQHAAMERAAEHAGNFMFNREKQVEHLKGLMGRAPLIVSPYDAELYGHWWYEGVDWLDFLMRKIAFDQQNIKMITPLNYLKLYPQNQIIQPAASSWGWKGYYEVWLNGSNDWIYPHLHHAADAMSAYALQYRGAGDFKRRLLNQMARELLLAQSSDWPFIMKTGTFSEYAGKRVVTHLQRFYLLAQQLASDTPRLDYLEDIESRDNIFPEIDYTIYA